MSEASAEDDGDGDESITVARAAKNYYNGYTDSGTLLDVSTLTYEDYKAMHKAQQQQRSSSSDAEASRQKRLESLAIDPSQARQVTPMGLLEELAMVLVFAFGIPGGVITVPILTAAVGYFTGAYLKTSLAVLLLLLPLALLPLPKYDVSNKESWLAYLMIKYFSFKIVRGGRLPDQDFERPIVLVAPPHGVFPFGNILTMIGYPMVMGYDFTGLAASAVFRTPIFRQLLTVCVAAV